MVKKSPIIIVGHYGSGKTEFVANLALLLKRETAEEITVADLDIVNPYFRIREMTQTWVDQGIRILSSNYETDYYLDMPALAASVQTCFEPGGPISIIDVGGDPAGATVLSRYSAHLPLGQYEMWMVVNANRPQTASVEHICSCMTVIQQASRLTVTGLVHNTHLLQETAVEDILRGDALIRQVSQQTGLPVVYTMIPETLRTQTYGIDLAGPPFYMRPIVRPDWL